MGIVFLDLGCGLGEESEQNPSLAMRDPDWRGCACLLSIRDIWFIVIDKSRSTDCGLALPFEIDWSHDGGDILLACMEQGKLGVGHGIEPISPARISHWTASATRLNVCISERDDVAVERNQAGLESKTVADDG